MILGSALQCLAMILLAYGLTQTDGAGGLTGKASYVAAVGLFLFIAAFVGIHLHLLSANVADVSNFPQSGMWLVPSVCHDSRGLLVITNRKVSNQWIYGAEISPLKIRSKANSLGISVQYLMNFVVVMVTPVAIARIGGRYYIVFAVTNAAIAIALHFLFPEVSLSSIA